MKRIFKISSDDNIAVALEDLEKNDIIQDVVVRTDIPKGHKIALCNIEKNKDVYKYGYSIGKATTNISVGDHVHSHNLATQLNDNLEYTYSFINKNTSLKLDVPKVNLFKRLNGTFATRNELWVIPTVGCVNGIVNRAVNQFLNEHSALNIDDIVVLSHTFGCSQMGEDHGNTKKILQSLIHNPNCGAALVVGLGCENNQVSIFKETLGEYDSNRVKFLILQECKNEHDELLKILEELYNIMKHDKREEALLSDLIFGLECGGSDGFSGLTANPLLGLFSDFITQNGGTVILTEVPEMFGAEQILMSRAANKEIFNKIVKLINNFKAFFKNHGEVIYDNPSPGNKAGGITTLEEKSLGCTEKAGRAVVVDVVSYAGKVVSKGLNLLESPGNDPIATTALIAAGAQIILFTTGRGNPYGGIVPTVKISTNTALAEEKSHWIDFNAGSFINSDDIQLVLLKEFIKCLVDIANGKKTNNEKNKFKEIAIFKTGVTL